MMGEVAGLVGLALGLAALEWRVIVMGRNLGTVYNGLGAVAGTLARSNAAPMRYRVLVPWALRWVPLGRWLVVYEVLKMGLMAGALVAAWSVVGMRGALAMAVLMAVTFEFDYWDCYAELLGVALCLSGSVVWIALGAFLWGFSRETAMMAPILALGASGRVGVGLAGLTGPLALGIVRLVQGRAALYCERWTWRAYNWPDLRAVLTRQDSGLVVSVLWSVAMAVMVVLGQDEMPVRLARTAPLALVWIGTGWTMARARETRIFLATGLWMVG